MKYIKYGFVFFILLSIVFWISYTAWFAYLFFGSFTPICSCISIGNLEINTEENFIKTKSYPIKNKIKNIESPQVYIYSEIDQKLRNSQLSPHRSNCSLPIIIGEIYPGNFEYEQFVSGFTPTFFLGEDYKIYEIIAAPKEDRCFIK